MPTGFLKCVRNGGRVWTRTYSDGTFQRFCTLDGVTYPGERKPQNKTKEKEDDRMDSDS